LVLPCRKQEKLKEDNMFGPLKAAAAKSPGTFRMWFTEQSVQYAHPLAAEEELDELLVAPGRGNRFFCAREETGSKKPPAAAQRAAEDRAKEASACSGEPP
jgi:hypothetical protein